MKDRGLTYGILLVVLSTGILVPVNVNAQSLGFDGQALGWTTLNPEDPFQAQAGLRYIPELNFTLPSGKYSFEGEFSANLWVSGIYSGDSIKMDEEISPYRMWVKFSGDQFELRAVTIS